MAKKIVVTSGKGGVGKTTVTANLGMALASFGLKVLLVDIDFGLNNLDVVLGVENKVCYDICDAINGRCRVKQALVRSNERQNLFILSSRTFDMNNRVSGQNIKLLLDGLNNVFDYILIDCPAGIDVGFHRAVSCADQALIVVTPNSTSLRDADKVVSVLKSYKLDSLGLIINRARGDLICCNKMMKPYDIVDLLKVELVGVLPEEDNVFLSSGYKLSKSSESYKCYKILAKNIHNNERKIFDVQKKYSGFFGSIRGSIKRKV